MLRSAHVSAPPHRPRPRPREAPPLPASHFPAPESQVSRAPTPGSFWPEHPPHPESPGPGTPTRPSQLPQEGEPCSPHPSPVHPDPYLSPNALLAEGPRQPPPPPPAWPVYNYPPSITTTPAFPGAAAHTPVTSSSNLLPRLGHIPLPILLPPPGALQGDLPSSPRVLRSWAGEWSLSLFTWPMPAIPI